MELLSSWQCGQNEILGIPKQSTFIEFSIEFILRSTTLSNSPDKALQLWPRLRIEVNNSQVEPRDRRKFRSGSTLFHSTALALLLEWLWFSLWWSPQNDSPITPLISLLFHSRNAVIESFLHRIAFCKAAASQRYLAVSQYFPMITLIIRRATRSMSKNQKRQVLLCVRFPQFDYAAKSALQFHRTIPSRSSIVQFHRPSPSYISAVAASCTTPLRANAILKCYFR